MSGQYQVHDERLKIFKTACDSIAALFVEVKMVWIPREQNKEADFLSKAINPDHGFGGCVPTWEEVIRHTQK